MSNERNNRFDPSPENRRRDEDFVQRVLANTSGSACDRACEQLPDLTDGRLTGLDRQLVQSHLEHCSGCRQVAVTLGWMGQTLPAMAEMDPGPNFLAGVLARTTAASDEATIEAQNAERRPMVSPRWQQIQQWFERMYQRPSFNLEMAYVATVLVVLLTAFPGSPLRNAPGQALRVMRAGPSQLPLIGVTINSGFVWLDEQAAGAVNNLRALASDGLSDVDESLDARNVRSADSRKAVSDHLDAAAEALRQRDPGQAGFEITQAIHFGKQAWLQWWNVNSSDDGNRKE